MTCGNNMNWVTAVAYQFARLRASRLVLKITNPVIRPKDGRLRRIYRRARYRHAFAMSDAILALCDNEASRLRSEFPRAGERIRTVVNPYVTPAMLELATERDRDRNAGMILAIGRFEPQKQFDLLIRSFALIEDQNLHLVILGDGEERPRLEALVRELGLQNRVSMPGYVADVGPWLSRARLLALSSRYEGLPAVVLEAFAAGCPVVTTNCFKAASELVGNAEGCFVVPDATPERFAAALARCCSVANAGTLADRAAEYSIDAGVQSHLAAVSADLLAEPA